MSDWQRVRFGDVVQVNYGKALPQARRHGGDIPVYGSNGIVGWHDEALTSAPVIVIGRKGSSGEVNFSKVPCWPIDTTYFIDEPGPYQMEFLDRLLKSLGLTELDRSTAIPGLNRNQLYDIEVPVPPPADQVKISQLTNAIEQKLVSTVAHLRAAQRAIERFRQSVLAAACSGRLTADWREEDGGTSPTLYPSGARPPKQLRNIESYDLDEIPDGWTWVQVENLLPPGGIFDGPFGSNLKTSDYTDTGARVIRLENIGHLKFISDKRTFVSTNKYQSLAKHKIYPGDIVFSSFVDEQVRVCILPIDLDAQAIAKADCFTLRTLPLVDRQYLALHLASWRSYQYLAGDIHGATRPRVNTTQVRSLPIPLCSFAEQREIVSRYERLVALADSLEQRVETASRRIERSSQAVPAKAFRGELSIAPQKEPV